jgi:hypothetical protein
VTEKEVLMHCVKFKGKLLMKRISLGFVLATFVTTACSSSHNDPASQPASIPSKAQIPSVTGPAIAPAGSTVTVTTPTGESTDLALFHAKSKAMIAVQGTLSDEAFLRLESLYANKPRDERNALLHAEMTKTFKSLQTVGGIPVSENDDVGYFRFYLPYQQDVMGAVRSLTFNNEVLMEPVIFNHSTVSDKKPSDMGLVAKSTAVDTTAFSGLEKIHAPEFVTLAESQIGGGVKVDGSSVNLGITDTGITYNHPTFLAADQKTVRITYMKDFTGEGTVYFNPAAKFSAVAGTSDDQVIVTADVIATPNLPNIPSAGDLLTLKQLPLHVSADLKAKLLDPNTKARFGFMNEANYQGGENPVDINANGKLDDKFPMILIMNDDPTKSVLYFDPTGTGDFRSVPALSDWNTSHTTQAVFAEKIGFSIQAAQLPASDDPTSSATANVQSVAIVGYDPGPHGTHVAGIAGGRQTIANDSPNTLARGVAPNANILSDRVCANNGGCDATAAMADIVTSGQADVVNMSLGGLTPFNDGYGVQETLLNRLTLMSNALFVVAAGNDGPGRRTVGSPGTARLSLTIGATASKGLIQRQYEWPGGGPTVVDAASDQDFMLYFSSRGPTASGGFKPNVTAPGTELSSIQLNSALGTRAGLDVYWGTSMATPTAAGAYALLLDAARKYNKAHPTTPLSADAMTLRNVLIESARAFNRASFDPQTKKQTQGDYSWIDEGAGMIDLVSAWKELIALRDNAVPSAVTLNGQNVDLDYSVITSMKNPEGIAYDGTRAGYIGQPAFGTGVFVDYAATDFLEQVQIARRIPDGLAAGVNAGDLARQLETTKDEFVLKTVFTGATSGTAGYPEWLKAGTRDQISCVTSPTQNLTVLGRGVEIQVAANNTGTLNPLPASVLNVCLDRDAIKNKLAPGDHGALIYAYRTVGGKTSPLASFVVPVYLTVPNKTLGDSTSYKVSSKVSSFGVNRNYVTIPKGTSVVKLTMTVPPVANSATDCSYVVLEGLLGSNSTIAGGGDITKQRAVSCTTTGAIAPDALRTMTLTEVNPTPGVWDLPVFGIYMFTSSSYTLQVDYVTGTSDTTKIELALGSSTSLAGSLNWTLKDSSMTAIPDPAQSALTLEGLLSSLPSKVAQDGTVYTSSPLGQIRAYPDSVKSVTLGIGNSPGNDIDLFIFSCDVPPAGTALPTDPSQCTDLVGKSDGPTDTESVTFTPDPAKLYVARVSGSTVKDAGAFTSTELLVLAPEKGEITLGASSPAAGGGTTYSIGYALSAADISSSALLKNSFFLSGQYVVTGSLSLKAADGTPLMSVPVTVAK